EGLFHRATVEQDLDEQLQLHIEERADTIERTGICREEALRRARLEFGAMENYKERCREARGLRWPDELMQDLRYAVRMARKSPGFTAVAVLSLALGIGANTAMFSILNSLLLETLPVRDPSRLVELQMWRKQGQGAVSYPLYLRLRSNLAGAVLEDVCGSSGPQPANVSAPGGEPAKAVRALVTTSYFDLLDVPLIAGRSFGGGEDPAGSPLAAVISERFWKIRLGGDPSIVGKTLMIDDRPATVIGIAGGRFSGIEVGSSTDVWTNFSAGDRQQLSEGWNSLNLLGRMKANTGVQQVQAALSATFDVYQHERMAALPNFKRTRALMEAERMAVGNGATGTSRLRRRFATPLRIVAGVVALVLLLACVNITNLLLARAAKRQREIATRLSLGAGAARLFRQFLTESLLLAICGGLLGLAVAAWTSRHLLDLIPQGDIPVALDIHLNWRVLLFTAGVAIGAGLLFGIVPALRVSRSRLSSTLKFNSASDFGGASGKIRPGTLLSAAQIALSTLLVFGAGLFVRTLENLKNVDSGFRAEHVSTFDLTPPRSYSDKQKQEANRLVVERVRSVPGVNGVSISWPGVFNEGRFSGDIRIPGVAIPEDAKHDVDLMLVGPEFFRVMGATLLAGCEFRAGDDGPAATTAVINERLAAMYFPGQNPVGMKIQPFPRSREPVIAEIAGVVHNIRHFGLRESAAPALYLPITELDLPWAPTIEVRLERDLTSASRDIQRAVAEVDPRLRVGNFATLDQRINAYLEKERMLATVAGLFSSIALALAAVGLYGVMSYAVARRTKEFGLRMALGASRRRVLDMILRDGIGVAAMGVALGVPASLALSRFVSALLFDVKPSDAGSLMIPLTIMLATAVTAVLVPAWRATRVDPMVALREE
ncbi:MAG TPA: ABC transporter permease, partial [Bryobacteraceae bacterium]|nr:ABC transporter permease [Bryobacteraceae bacterium]